MTQTVKCKNVKKVQRRMKTTDVTPMRIMHFVTYVYL